jgi:hypothetical protein
MNTTGMSINPKAIQELLDELEASKQSRLRAWKVLQRLRLVLSETGNIAIPPSAIGSEDIRRGRRDPGTCFDKILPDSERRDQELVLLGTPLPGRLLREAVGFIGQSTLELTRHTY